jgi:D-xylose transport system permease protein
VTTLSPEVQAAAEEGAGLGALVRARIDALNGGDVGSLPVIVGIVLITIFFTLKSSFFFTSVNFINLTQQMAGVATIVIGVVFVLLIGEIDLSIGYLGGLAGIICAELQMPDSGHQLPGLLAIAVALAAGAAIGAAQGSVVALVGVPSFVVTLAGLLAWQGVILKILDTEGVINIQDQKINDVASYILPKNVGWILAAVFTVGYALSTILSLAARQREGLSLGNPLVPVIRVAFWGVLAFVLVAVYNHSRGVPFVGVLVVVLTALGSFLAGRTTFGQHVYAVGGNAEAARRAGINVPLIRILVFMISGAMAAMGGIIFASRLNSVDLTAGGGTILLDSISAAVIGGVSLFGGRGFVKGALFGGLIIGMIANGIDLVGSADWVKYVTTAVILLSAVILDTVLRRRQAHHGVGAVDHPIRLEVTDDLARNRLTVLFRILLAIPHLLLLAVWGIAFYAVAIANWFATLFAGRSPQRLHDFQARYLRYTTQVSAYMFLLADPFPVFGGDAGYAVDLQVPPPETQTRATVLFRLVLVIPAYILGALLGLLLELLAFLGWFAALVTGRMPDGLQNLGVLCLRYQIQTSAYLFLLTPRYPSLSTGASTAPAASALPAAAAAAGR